MRRIEQPPRVIYVERNVKWSLFFVILSFATALGVFFAAPAKKEDAFAAVAFYGGGFLLVSLMILFKVRAFVVDREKRELYILHRGFLQKSWRRSYPIGHVSVRDVVRPARAIFAPAFSHWVFIDVDGALSVLFVSQRGEEEPLDLARQMASDLDRPLLHDHRRV